jgi:hypothetical protein
MKKNLHPLHKIYFKTSFLQINFWTIFAAREINMRLMHFGELHRVILLNPRVGDFYGKIFTC